LRERSFFLLAEKLRRAERDVKQKEKDRSIILNMNASPTIKPRDPAGSGAPELGQPRTLEPRQPRASEARQLRTSEPRERLLSTASELFYRDGIHSVGVDRIVDAANVTRATFYRHFPSKEDLVTAYLQAEDAALRAMFDGALATISDPEGVLDALIAGIAQDITLNHTRGCPFINASAEYPDATSSVRLTVKSHRDWFASTLEAALVAAARDDAAERSRALVLLRDAALVGGYLDGADTMRDTFIRTAKMVAGLK
jgi:AcrR family transcriptional regulator